MILPAGCSGSGHGLIAKKLNILVFLLLTGQLLSSCALIGFNPKHRTPKKETRIPAFTASDSLLGSANPLRVNNDILFYRLKLDVDIPGRSVSGSVKADFKALENMDSLQLDLVQNLQIDSIVSQGKRLNFTRKYRAIFIALPETVYKGEKSSLTVYYSGKPQIAPRPPWEGGFVWKTDDNKQPWVGVACELIGSSIWWPGKDYLPDEPDSMEFNITAPEGLTCVANGKFKESITQAGKSTFRWMVHYPINTYNASFYIGDFRHFTVPYKGIEQDFDLDYYVLPHHLEKARQHFRQVNAIIGFYEKTFGPYPWPKDGYKLVESPYMGMEHQSAIAYGSKFNKSFMGLSFDYIILHETAHEWWGNSVSAADYADIWLQEGFATYSEALYVENTFGKKDASNYLWLYSMMIRNKKPLVGPRGVGYWPYKDGDPYMKGALMLHSLRALLDNDPMFFDILRSFYKKYTYGIATTSDFTAMAKTMSGTDLDWFFEQYLYHRECPKLVYNYFYDKEKKSNILAYKWTDVVPGFQLPVKVMSSQKSKLIIPTTKVQTLDLGPEKEIFFDLKRSYFSVSRSRKLK